MTRLNDDNRTSLVGMRQVWGGEQPFVLRHGDRRQHVYICGQTGTGKSTLLRSIIASDIAGGQGVAVIDPHGELCEELLDYVPPSRMDHVVYYNPADLDYPIPYNLLAGAKPDEIHLLASGIVTVFKSLWSQSWGPRLELLLFATISALAECNSHTGNVSLLGVPRMLIDQRYRQYILTHVRDVAVRAFWLNEFTSYDARFTSEMISPLQNKVGALLISPVLRNTLGQVRKAFDLRFMMDHRRIFLANLSRGRIGEDKANLLGALLVAQISQAAFSRANTKAEERADFWLTVDEFGPLTNDSFATMLAEIRKMRVGITLSNQHQGQLREDIRSAIFGNVGTLISFRVGESDGANFEREFGGTIPAREFTNLENFTVLVKLLEGGGYRDPFRARTIPSDAYRHGRREIVIKRSRERYGIDRKVVEDRIRRWMQ